MTLRKISPEALYKRLKDQEDVMLLDVRAEGKYNEFHIENPSVENINIPKNNIFDGDTTSIHTLPKDKEIIVTCTTGNSATKCAGILADQNYNVTVLEGGVTAWKAFLETKG